MDRSSEFSKCGKYRYILRRIWDWEKPIAMCIGLNPSNAGRKKNDGTEEDDTTIRILIKSLTALGFGGLKMVNLYALISPHPSDLHNCPDPQNGNDGWIETTAYSVQEIIFCWGNFKGIEFRAKKIIKMFPDGKCFGRNSNGSPWHPRAMTYIKDFKIDNAKLERYANNVILFGRQ